MKTTRRNRPTQITDAPEHREIPIERIELRDGDGDDDNEIVLEGYASTFEEYDMYGGPQSYGWIERIDPKAFDITLREKPDLHLLINHAGMPLARTKSGNLDLKADGTGLKVTARLDKRDPEVQSLAVKMERGDMDEMSFAFRVKAQEWRAADGFEDDNQSYRTITEVSLHKGDVSVVNWGANPNTSVGLRSLPDAVKMLADADADELAEVRSADGDLLVRAVENLSKLVKPAVPTITIENINVRSDEDIANEAKARPHGSVVDGVEMLCECGDATAEHAIASEGGAVRGLPEGIADDVVKFTSELAEAGMEALAETFGVMLKRIADLEEVIAGKPGATEDDERSEDVVEETADETPEEVRTPSRLDVALAEQGILPEKLSVAAALAFAD